MRHLRARWALALPGALLLLASAAPARGGFLVNVTSLVTQESPTVFRYDYQVTVPSTSTLNASEFFIDVSPLANLTTIATTTGWDISYSAGDPNVDFSSPSSATDLLPGQTGFFEFRSPVGPGLQAFDVRSLDDIGTPLGDVAGTALAPVPEPSSLALGTLGGILLYALRNRRRATI